MKKIENINMISFSGGKTSAYMTIELLKKYEYRCDNTFICFANTGLEEEATLIFVKQCDELFQKEFNKKIHWLEFCKYNKWKWVTFETASRKGEPLIDLVLKRKIVPNVVSKMCTQELKIRVMRDFMKSWAYKSWYNIIGIRYDEPDRYFNLINDHSNRWENKCPLWDWKIIETDIINFWEKMHFKLQLKHYRGNCNLCIEKNQAKRIQILREEPSVAEVWIMLEELTGTTFKLGYTTRSLLQRAESQLTLFPEEINDKKKINCFCGD